MIVDQIKNKYYRLINNIKCEKFRYLYKDFKINDRLFGIIGPRGVGKTTLMLQYIKNQVEDIHKTMYLSADHLFFPNSEYVKERKLENSRKILESS